MFFSQVRHLRGDLSSFSLSCPPSPALFLISRSRTLVRDTRIETVFDNSRERSGSAQWRRQHGQLGEIALARLQKAERGRDLVADCNVIRESVKHW